MSPPSPPPPCECWGPNWYKKQWSLLTKKPSSSYQNHNFTKLLKWHLALGLLDHKGCFCLFVCFLAELFGGRIKEAFQNEGQLVLYSVPWDFSMTFDKPVLTCQWWHDPSPPQRVLFVPLTWPRPSPSLWSPACWPLSCLSFHLIFMARYVACTCASSASPGALRDHLCCLRQCPFLPLHAFPIRWVTTKYLKCK